MDERSPAALVQSFFYVLANSKSGHAVCVSQGEGCISWPRSAERQNASSSPRRATNVIHVGTEAGDSRRAMTSAGQALPTGGDARGQGPSVVRATEAIAKRFSKSAISSSGVRQLVASPLRSSQISQR